MEYLAEAGPCTEADDEYWGWRCGDGRCGGGMVECSPGCGVAVWSQDLMAREESLAPEPSDANGGAGNDVTPPARGAPTPKLWPPPATLTPITNRENAAVIEKSMRIFACKVAAVGSIGGVLFGYDLGVVAGAILQLQAQFDLSKTEVGGLVSILLVGSVLGAFVGGAFTDRYGRRLAIMCTDLAFIVGSLAIATSPTVAQVLIGRFVVGIGVSVSAIADVAYLNEMAPQKWRGTIVSVNEMMIAGGFLLGALLPHAVRPLRKEHRTVDTNADRPACPCDRQRT